MGGDPSVAFLPSSDKGWHPGLAPRHQLALFSMLVVQTVKNGPVVQIPGFDPWIGKIPGEGNGNPLKYSCLENPTDREAWWAIDHRVATSQTGPSS